MVAMVVNNVVSTNRYNSNGGAARPRSVAAEAGVYLS